MNCKRHNRPRPCPECGHGGAGRGQGRKPTLRDPVRVLVTLEKSELEAILERHPGMSRSAALRAAIGETPPGEKPAASAAQRDPGKERQISLTWEEMKTIRRPLYWRELPEDQSIRTKVAAVGAGKDWETSLPLEDCRQLRRVLKRFLDASDERLAEKIKEEEWRASKWRAKGSAPATRRRDERELRRELRAENGRVRKVRARIPWK